MKVWQIGMMSLLLAGCSAMGLGDKKIDYRTAAAQAPALDVPPDLTAVGTDDRYKVPLGDGESVATFSDYSKGSAVTGRKTDTVLPEVKGVSLARNGAQRWLVINDKPENVWTVVKAFFQENGLAIKSEDKAAGLIETEWAENRAKIPQDAIRNVLGKVFDNLYSSGERDQYRVRLERGKDGASTEIYLTHKGMEEVLSGDKSTSKWQARANDPEMEAIMLQRLMVRFGGSETPAELAAGVATKASGAFGTASVKEISGGGKTIVLNDAFDRSWRRVGLAIEQAGLVVEDKDRAKGIYFLRQIKEKSDWLDKLQIWKDKTNARYRVNVKDGGKTCEVSVSDQNGASDDMTRQLIETIYKNINL